MTVLSTVLCALVIVAVSHKTAYAYIDPASGGYLLQILLAGLLGALFALKAYGKRAMFLVRSLFRKSEVSDGDK